MKVPANCLAFFLVPAISGHANCRDMIAERRPKLGRSS